MNKIIKILLALQLLCLAVPATSQSKKKVKQKAVPTATPSDVATPNSMELPKAYNDTLPDSTNNAVPNLASINLFIRCYADSVVLRWAPENYVYWKHLNNVGYNVYRVDHLGDTIANVTLVEKLKPLSMQQMKAKYAPTDSMAMAAMSLLHGGGEMKVPYSEFNRGTMGSLMDLHQEQQTAFGFAVLISEWRPDLASDMAMRFVDKNLKKGEKYDYIVAAVKGDSILGVNFKSGYIENVSLMPMKPMPFNCLLEDSLMQGNSVMLRWNTDRFSTFEIERRLKGDKQWQRLNSRPYMPMAGLAPNQSEGLYTDNVPKPGRYEYRIIAHDLFGELTQPSEIHEVTVGDRIPPTPPQIKKVVISRPGKTSYEKVMATIHFHKDKIEPDLKGYLPVYYNERHTGDTWKSLSNKIIAPTDSTCTVEVTGLSTGMIAIVAYDQAENMSYSIPRQIRITDTKAPKAPTNLEASVCEDGRILLSWDPEPDDDVAYYDIAYANDTTHQFVYVSSGQVRVPSYIDSVSLDVNQRYIYYKVRAVDFANNVGPYSLPLQVERPQMYPPTVCHLDSAWTNEQGVHMRWVTGNDAGLSFHNIYRRMEGDKLWTLLDVIYQDAVLAKGSNIMQLTDKPAYDRRRRYEYAVESFSAGGVSSGVSLVYSALFQAPTFIKVPVKLMASYDAKTKATRLAWEANPPKDGDFYYCIYRKAQGDIFRFLISRNGDEPTLDDYNTQPGDTAEYYVMVKYKDGRTSQPSNIVTVVAPKQ